MSKRQLSERSPGCGWRDDNRRAGVWVYITESLAAYICFPRGAGIGNQEVVRSKETRVRNVLARPSAHCSLHGQIARAQTRAWAMLI